MSERQWNCFEEADDDCRPDEPHEGCPACNGDGYLIGPEPPEPLPYHVVVTINSLVHLVQLRWDGYEDMIPALNDDDLAALNACFGTDWGARGLGWDCDRPAAVTIRELGEAQADTDDPYWQSLAELHASRKCPDCGGPADHFRRECKGRVEMPRVPLTGADHIANIEAAYACPGPHEFSPASDTPGDCLACKPKNEPDFFVGRTSNATVGTIEVDRCSDDDCPVCGDE